MWEDIAQTACLYALTHRRTLWKLHVRDALKHEMRWQRSIPIEHPEWLASHYPSDEELADRLYAEDVEDAGLEWRRLPAAERDKLIAESRRAPVRPLNPREVP